MWDEKCPEHLALHLEILSHHAMQEAMHLSVHSGSLNQFQLHTEGSRLMLLLGPGKKPHWPKIALAKFLFYVRTNKINSP